MKVIAVIEDEEVIYRILAHLNLLSPGDGPRAPPGVLSSVASSVNNVPREPTYEPVYDDPPLAGLRVTPLPATLPTGQDGRGLPADPAGAAPDRLPIPLLP